MNSYEENVKAILRCCFSQSREDLIETAAEAIVALKCEPIVVNPAPNPIDPGFYQPFPPFTTTPAKVPNGYPIITCKDKESGTEDLKN